MPISDYSDESRLKTTTPIDPWIYGNRLAIYPAYVPATVIGDMSDRIADERKHPGTDKYSGHHRLRTTGIADMGIHFYHYHTSRHQLDSAR